MNVTEQMRVIGRKAWPLLALAFLAALLASAGVCCSGEEAVLEPPPSPTAEDGVATATFEVVTPEEAPDTDDTAAAVGMDLAELEYLVQADLLLGETLEILDDWLYWMDDVAFEYNRGMMFPDTAAGQSALDRMRDVARQVELLDPTPAFQESHGLWVAADKEAVTGMELGLAGVEQLDPLLIDQGTAHVVESNRLMDLSNDALDRME